MSAFILSDANFWFTAAVSVVLLIFLLETVGMLFGMSLLGLFENIPDADIEANGMTLFAGLSNWLALNRLPMTVWLTLFLTLFGLLGYLSNIFYSSLFNGEFIAPLLSMPIAVFLALTLAGRIGPFLADILPRHESATIHDDEFAGHEAKITIGVARHGSPAEARFIDRYSQPHYVLVEPYEIEDTFNIGDKIILVKKGQRAWLAKRYQ